MIVLLIVYALLIGFSIFMFIRVDRVAKYRLKLLRVISIRGRADIDNDRDWTWRHEEFDKVSFNEMVYKFWKPLDSFYQDKSFIYSDARVDIRSLN